MATEKLIPFPSCRAFLPAIRRPSRIAQALLRRFPINPRDRAKKSRHMTAETACRELAAPSGTGCCMSAAKPKEPKAARRKPMPQPMPLLTWNRSWDSSPTLLPSLSARSTRGTT